MNLHIVGIKIFNGEGKFSALSGVFGTTAKVGAKGAGVRIGDWWCIPRPRQYLAASAALFACLIFTVTPHTAFALTYNWDVVSVFVSMPIPFDTTRYGGTAHKNWAYGWTDLAGGPVTYFSSGQQIPAISDIPFVFVLNTDSTYRQGAVPENNYAYAQVGYHFETWLKLRAYDSLGNETIHAPPVAVDRYARLYNGQISALGYAQTEVALSFSDRTTVLANADPITDSRVKTFDIDGSGPHQSDYTSAPYNFGSNWTTIRPLESIIIQGNITLASAAWAPPSPSTESYARGNEVAFVVGLRSYTVPDESGTLLLTTLGFAALGLLGGRGLSRWRRLQKWLQAGPRGRGP